MGIGCCWCLKSEYGWVWIMISVLALKLYYFQTIIISPIGDLLAKPSGSLVIHPTHIL